MDDLIEFSNVFIKRILSRQWSTDGDTYRSSMSEEYKAWSAKIYFSAAFI